MKLSFDWLQDYVDTGSLTPYEVADKLTAGAFEVEEVLKVGSQLTGPVKVGEIVEINPHPNANKIRLAKVKIETNSDPLEIVCGAGNIAVGQRVPIALAGAVVLNRHDGSELVIKPTKIRGVESNGMLCSPGELGITCIDSEGILILEPGAILGSDVIELLHLYPDHILHVGSRSNRGDALSVLGLAREVAALCNCPLKKTLWQLPEIDESAESIEIEVENNIDCPFFSLRVLTGAKVGPSPLRLTRRLEAIGVRSVNNIVDITNYVLHELGQPLHAYDLAKLSCRQMVVRRARSGECVDTIDGRERELNEETLIIADTQRPLGVAGVMGGKDSEISDETVNIVLEAAAFQPSRVRRASRLLGLSSESSLQFERGVDVCGVRRASDRAAVLMFEICGARPGRLTYGGSDEVRPLQVALRLSQLKRLTEIDMSGDEVSHLLGRLEFNCKQTGDDLLAVQVPSFRQRDVTREIDLIEEVCRLWGYDRLPISMPAYTAAPDRPDDTEILTREAMSACGLNETYISSLTGVDPLGLGSPADDNVSLVHVLNPLSADHQALRSSLLPGLIKAVAYNQDRGAKSIWLYEVGRIYQLHGQSSARDTGVAEELHVATAIYGAQSLSTWQEQNRSAESTAQFYIAKGIVENLLTRLGIEANLVRFDSPDNSPAYLHPGRCANITYDRGDCTVRLGHLGEIHPAVSDKLNLRCQTALVELSVDALRTARKELSFAEIISTPSVVRDLTADFQQSIEHQTVNDLIKTAAGANLRQLDLVSVFQLPNGQKSLSYRLTFQDREHTLTAEAVEQHLSIIRSKLKDELSAAFRA